MKISDYYTYAPKSKIKAGDANPNGKYQFYASSPDKSRRCDEYLYDCKAIIMGTGGSATLHYYDGKFSTSTDCLTLIPNENIRAKYLYYFFLANMDVLEAGFKGAGLKHTNKGYIDSIEITKIPSLSSQDKIVNLFDGLASRIEKERRQIEKLDELVKARFVEMFGDLEDNAFNYSVKTIQEVCEQIKDGTHQTPTYTDDRQSGYIFLSSKDVTSGKVDWCHPKYIPEDLHRELYARVSPKKGDILLAKNGTTGVAAIVDKEIVFDIYVSLALLRPLDVNEVYLWAAINSDGTKKQFNSRLKGISVPNLHLGEIRKTRIIIPPIDLQNQFATFVAQVDKSKFALVKSIKLLKKSPFDMLLGLL